MVVCYLILNSFCYRCNTCGDYIYKGKKFNSRMERVKDKDYLGIQIHRFYIRCPKCVGVIAFKVCILAVNLNTIQDIICLCVIHTFEVLVLSTNAFGILCYKSHN